MSDITKQSLSELVENIKSKKLSSSEVTKAFVERSEKSKELNAYITEDYANALNKAKTFDEEKKVANKAPVDSISIQNISIEKDNNSKVEKVKNTKFEFIIKFADLFFEESAITLKKRLEDEYNLKDINIKKMSKNLYRVYKGPFYNLGSIKNVYNEIADINFENIELIKL